MKDFEEYYPQMFVAMLIGLVLLFVVRFIYLIIVNRKILMEYIKSEKFTFSGLCEIIAWREVFLLNSSSKDKYVFTKAKVIDTEEASYAYKPQGKEKKKIYLLTVKFRAGYKTVTTKVSADSCDKISDNTVEICYDPKNPANAYIADDPAIQERTPDETGNYLVDNLIAYLCVIGVLGFACYVLIWIVDWCF